MGKHKKKKNSKKIADAVPDDVLDAAVVSIRKFRKITNEIAKLSTGQKLVGGLVLAAAGYFYLDQRKGHDEGKSWHAPKFDRPRLTPPDETSATEAPAEAPEKAAAPHKSRKTTRHKKPQSAAARKPAAADYDDM